MRAIILSVLYFSCKKIFTLLSLVTAVHEHYDIKTEDKNNEGSIRLKINGILTVFFRNIEIHYFKEIVS
jgi:hypothetical protein